MRSDNIICVFNSNNEPIAIDKKCEKSLSERPDPSAMFEGTDTAARVICEIIP